MTAKIASGSLFKIICAIVFLLFVGLNCTSVEEDQPTDADKDLKFPDQESWESTITITKDARRLAEVWAGYIAFYNEDKIAKLKDSVHVDFYDEQGHHNSSLTADSGYVYNQTNDLKAIGNVKVVSDSGIVLETSELRWENEIQKIVSDVPVKFTTQEDTLLGDSFISDRDLTNYEIRNARGYSRRKIPIEK